MVWRHVPGVREGAHRGPEEVGLSALGTKLPRTQVHKLLRLQRVGGVATTPKQRSAFGQRSTNVLRAAVRQRKDLAHRRMLLQGGDAADLTAMGAVLSLQGFS